MPGWLVVDATHEVTGRLTPVEDDGSRGPHLVFRKTVVNRSNVSRWFMAMPQRKTCRLAAT